MLLKHPYVAMVTLDGCGNAAKLAEQIHQAGKQTAYALPYVLRETSEQLLEKGMDWKQFDRIWVRSYDGIGFAKDTLGIPVEKLALDAGLYVFSREASADFLAEGFVGYTASMELNHKELTHMENSQAELMLYGYAPLMVSAQCVYKNYASCIKERKNGSKSQPEHLYLNDRYQKQFEVSRNCTHCYNVIYNSQPTSLLHQAREAGQKSIDDTVHMRADKSVEIELFQIRLAEGVADDDAVIQRVGIVLDGLDQLGIVLVGERGRQNEKHVAGLFFALFFALRQAVVQLLSCCEHALLGLVAEGDLIAVA